MSVSARQDSSDDEPLCDDHGCFSLSLLATGSALFLGYFVGRVSFAKDVREAVRRIEESPEPIEVFVRTM